MWVTVSLERDDLKVKSQNHLVMRIAHQNPEDLLFLKDLFEAER
jgi:hypothetical protein